MARILLIETATEVCSAAVAVDGTVVVLQEELNSMNHAALLTLQIEACARESGIPLHALDAVAVSRGPGSYTSLRVGASVAKGICYALEKPLIAVDTLLALARATAQPINQSTYQPVNQSTSQPINQSTNQRYFMPMLDARRQEVWTAVYDAEMNLRAEAQPLILENDLFQNFLQRVMPDFPNVRVILSGNGAGKLENVRRDEGAVSAVKKNCSAADLAAEAERLFQKHDFQDVAYWEPFYMKLPNITSPVKKL
jgi:tRNA threonylcarbamoyladenosine biosynthesis protein TsaB